MTDKLSERLLNAARGEDGLASNVPNTLLREAAAALEAAREDTERIEWLERNCVNVADEYGTGSQLYFGTYASGPLRAAIDQVRGKENGNG